MLLILCIFKINNCENNDNILVIVSGSEDKVHVVKFLWA
jgi:hypothetical protein